MELNVLNRLLLLNSLPKEGNITTLRIVQKLREDLSFSEDEHKKLNFLQNGDSLTWDTTTPVVKDVNVGPKAHALIVETLEALSKNKKLTADFLPLFDLFVKDEAE